MADHTCEIHGNHMVAKGDFSRDSDTSFDDACQKLTAADDKDLIADLVGVEYMASTYVGLLAEMCLGAKGAGKKVTFRANPKLAASLREAGLDHVAALEVVGE